MANIVFHGPNDSNECRKQVRKLAKEWNGKFSYNSFFNARRMEMHDGWFSKDTIGKAAYVVVVPLNKYKSQGSRSDLAGLIRKVRKMELPHGLKFRTWY